MITRARRFVARFGTDAGTDHDHLPEQLGATPRSVRSLRSLQRPFELSPVGEQPFVIPCHEDLFGRAPTQAASAATRELVAL
jgi:hypothetical protein